MTDSDISLDAALDRIVAALADRPRGLFITFEGGDGSGKSTQAELLHRALEPRGAAALFTHEPGGTELGQELRRLVMHGPDNVDARTEALLYATDRAYHVATMMRPALEGGTTVFSDRYIDSSVAYQGIGRGLGEDEVRNLSLWATDGLLPDAVLLYEIDPKVGLARVGAQRDRLERAGGDFHAQVTAYYRRLAEADPQRYRVIDGGQSIEDTFADTVKAVLEIATGQESLMGDR